MSQERSGAGEVIGNAQMRALVASIRKPGEMPTLDNVERKFGAETLFTMAHARAALISQTLVGLDRSIGAISSKREAFNQAKERAIRQIKDDPIYTLTTEFLRRRSEEVPSILEEAEGYIVTSPRVDKFVLDGRPYGEEEGSSLRLLYLASPEYPLAIHTLDALAYPKLFSPSAHTKIEAIVTKKLPERLATYNPNYAIVLADPTDETDERKYYLKERILSNTQSTLLRVKAPDRAETTKPTVHVLVTSRSLIVNEKEFSLMPYEKAQRPSPRAIDAMKILLYLHEHDGVWVKSAEFMDVLSRPEDSMRSAGYMSTRVMRASNWLTKRLFVDGDSVIKTRQSTNGYELGIFDYEVAIRPVMTYLPQQKS